MMKKIVRLTESDLTKLIKKVIKESEQNVQMVTAINDVNNQLKNFEPTPLEYDEISQIESGNENVSQSIEDRYSVPGEPVGKNKKRIRDEARAFICKYSNDKNKLLQILSDVFSMKKNRKKVNENIESTPSDLIYAAGFVLILIVFLISGRRKGGKYGCPGTWGNRGY